MGYLFGRQNQDWVFPTAELGSGGGFNPSVPLTFNQSTWGTGPAGGSSNGQTVTNSNPLNTTGGSILIASISQERTAAQPGFATVTGVTGGTGLTWARRSIKQLTVAATGVSGQMVLDIWWAYSAVSQVNQTITVTTDLITDATTYNIYSVGGFSGTQYQTNPWDSNASLPAVSSNGSTTTIPTITGVSTSSANTLVFGFLAGNLNPNAGVGWSHFANSGNIGGTNSCAAIGAVQAFTTPINNQTFTFTTGDSWYILSADAISGNI